MINFLLLKMMSSNWLLTVSHKFLQQMTSGEPLRRGQASKGGQAEWALHKLTAHGAGHPRGRRGKNLASHRTG